VPKGSVAVVGEVMVTSTKAAELKRTSKGFAAAIERLTANDLVIGNLEMPISERGYRVRKFSNLRSDPSVLLAVQGMGFQTVSLANNHMMDFGAPALEDTLAYLNEAGIQFAGAGLDLEESMAPVISQAGDARVGMVSFSCTLPMESDAGIEKPGIAPIRVGFSFEVDPNLMVEQPGTMPVVQSWTDPDDRAAACDVISELRRQVDFLIVMIHWGVPNYWLSPAQGYLAMYQQVLGHAFVDAGADAICGHHSHSLHPVEVYQGKPIFYSLGNFLFEGARSWMEPESVIVEFDLGKQEINLVPMLLDKDGFPSLVDGATGHAVLEKLRLMSLPFGDAIRNEGVYGRVAID
jgi:poly-gamma-glutamate capsule biosynthesis protein CapA/YwtB (metallophosphatase superfamily)